MVTDPESCVASLNAAILRYSCLIRYELSVVDAGLRVCDSIDVQCWNIQVLHAQKNNQFYHQRNSAACESVVRSKHPAILEL
jgi:hypothetical protein